MKIEKLTKEQEIELTKYRDKWIVIGLDTKRSNRKLAENWCNKAYEVAGLEKPKMILWAESPIGLLMTAKLVNELAAKGYKPYDNIDTNSVRASVWDSVRASVRDSVRDSVWASVRASVGASVGASVRASVRDSVRDSVWASVRDSVRDSVWDSVRDSVWDSVWASVRDSVWDSVRASVRASSALRAEWNECGSYGQHDANWLGFYNYFLEVCDLKKETEKLIPLMELSKETGWHLFYKNIAILSEKPTELHRNERGQLHNFNGPAIKWADGYELYRFNGVRIDGKEQYATKTEFTKEEFLSETNADVRRELSRKIGIEKTIELIGAEVIDTYNSKIGGKYELLLVDYNGRGKRPYLRMRNPSMNGVNHIEGVPANIKTCKDALAYRMGLDKYVEPIKIT